MNQNPHEFKILLVQLAIFSEHVHRAHAAVCEPHVITSYEITLVIFDFVRFEFVTAWKQQRLDEMFN